jgi:2-polyprenyl-6-methoxyphenol hydroxylase-like FAD-dependent oxidoreductase
MSKLCRLADCILSGNDLRISDTAHIAAAAQFELAEAIECVYLREDNFESDWWDSKNMIIVGITNYRIFKIENSAVSSTFLSDIQYVNYKANGLLHWDKIEIIYHNIERNSSQPDTYGIYHSSSCQFMADYLAKKISNKSFKVKEILDPSVDRTEQIYQQINSQLAEKKQQFANVLIIGAGPCGLWAALQLKLHQPLWNISIIEQYSSYRRHHNISLSTDSIAMAKLDPSLFGDFFDTKHFHKNKRNIQTAELENLLKVAAQKLNITIKIHKLGSIEEISTIFPGIHFNIIIGADGSKSFIRKTIFGDEFAEKSTIQFAAQLKFLEKNCGRAARALDLATESYPLCKALGKCMEEHVKHSPNQAGQHSITANITPITEEDFKLIENSSFKQPMKIKLSNSEDFDVLNTEIPARWRELTRIYLNARQIFTGNLIVPDSVALTAIPLQAHLVEKSVKIEKSKGIVWILAGDAAAGVPFFRSLNNGLRTINYLARCMAKIPENKLNCTNLGFAALHYDKYLHSFGQEQIKVAKQRGKALNLADSLLKLAASAPIQWMSFCPCKVSALSTTNPGLSPTTVEEFNRCKCSALQQLIHLPSSALIKAKAVAEKAFSGPEEASLRYQKLFNLPSTENLIETYNCALKAKAMLYQGLMYISSNYCCFRSNVFNANISIVMPFQLVSGIELAKLLFIPNSILLHMNTKGKDQYFFTSFINRQLCYEKLIQCKDHNKIGENSAQFTNSMTSSTSQVAPISPLCDNNNIPAENSVDDLSPRSPLICDESLGDYIEISSTEEELQLKDLEEVFLR